MTDDQMRRAEQWAADEEAERSYQRLLADEAASNLHELIHVLARLENTAPGRIIADALGVGTMPLPDLAKRLTLRAMRITPPGDVPA